MQKTILALIFLISTLIGCREEPSEEGTCQQNDFDSKFVGRNFNMGFSTWSFGPKEVDVAETYNFIKDNGDIYSEQIDGQIPWKEWMNGAPLPESFTNAIQYKVAHKILGRPLVLSVSLLNTARNELVEDLDGSLPPYQTLNDTQLREAYLKHVRYLVDNFSPTYLVFAMEVNELRIHDVAKWKDYKLMAEYIRMNLKGLYPNLKIAESFTLHNWFNPEVADKAGYIEEMKSYILHSDFAAISFYPFMKGLRTKNEFQQAFDFLHAQTNKPFAFVETCHLAEDLSIENFDLFIESNECDQNLYLETLLENAQQKDYEFVIWWAHRDYDALWETFPSEVKDIGKLWKDTGLLNESGTERVGYNTWQLVIKR